jgi:dihydroneopterin aldolase
MTKMLASVTGKAEAEIVIANGADIVDLKDPRTGALGALPIATIRQTIETIARRRPTSAVCGDLPMQPETIHDKVLEIASTGVDYVKVGFFPADNTAACAWALADLAKKSKLIAVLFADRKPDLDLLPLFAEHGFHGIMIDTADKSNGRLLDHMPPERVPGFVAGAKRLGLTVGLAGSLEAPDVPRLLSSKPDFLGFRRALCSRAKRVKAIDPQAVAVIRALIPEERPSGRTGQVDYRLLAARGYSPDSADLTLKTNRIFVRDFVLPVQIGAYSFEHGHTQDVRFDVTADVLRTVSNPEDMRHVFSYDVIMDGIRAMVVSGHVQLVEALAEAVAAHVLQDPRVMRITVRVEKLELGPGGVGVEIERTRKELALQTRRAQPAGNDGGGFTGSNKKGVTS